MGFDECLSARTSTSTLSSPIRPLPAPAAHARSQSQPLRSKPPIPARRNLAAQDSPLAKRPRAPSDPFLDTPAISSRSYSPSPRSISIPLSASLSDTIDSSSPSTPHQDLEDIFNPRPAATYGSQEIDEEYMRTWTSPDLTNPEILQLLKVFPTFITRRATPRFPNNAPDSRAADLEAGQDSLGAAGEIRIGTGRMWVSEQLRSSGWEGSWWTRFKNWWHQLFC